MRDFTYVEDVADGLLRLGICSAPPGEIVNWQPERLSSVREFVEIASDVLPIQKSQLNFGAIPTRIEEMEHLPVSIGRLEKRISWRPPTSIREGIQRTWKFEQQVRSSK